MPGEHFILVNLGTPAAPTEEAVRDFLEEFLLDPKVVDWPRWIWKPILTRFVLRSRPERVARLYRTIWREQGSPLEDDTQKMARGLRSRLRPHDVVWYAFRYGSPSIRSAFERARDHSASRIGVVSLFPQRTGSTTGSIDRAVLEIATEMGVRDRLDRIEVPPDDEGYIEALAGRYAEVCPVEAPRPDHLLISFHGIPVRYDRREVSAYQADCRRTAEALCTRLGVEPDRVTLAYQSKFGPEPWIQPPTDRTLMQLAREGVRRIAVITPGFLTDGLETLEEIGIRGKETFRAAGGKELVLVPAVADHPAWLDSLARRLAGQDTES